MNELIHVRMDCGIDIVRRVWKANELIHVRMDCGIGIVCRVWKVLCSRILSLCGNAERSCRCQLASCLILTFVLSRDELSARVITIVLSAVLHNKDSLHSRDWRGCNCAMIVIRVRSVQRSVRALQRRVRSPRAKRGRDAG